MRTNSKYIIWKYRNNIGCQRNLMITLVVFLWAETDWIGWADYNMRYFVSDFGNTVHVASITSILWWNTFLLIRGHNQFHRYADMGLHISARNQRSPHTSYRLDIDCKYSKMSGVLQWVDLNTSTLTNKSLFALCHLNVLLLSYRWHVHFISQYMSINNLFKTKSNV